MISIHYTTQMHCNQNTNSTRQHTQHNKANHLRIAFSTRHFTIQKNLITWQTLCQLWIPANLKRSWIKTWWKITRNRRKAWTRISSTAMTIIKWIIMIIVMMTYWHHIITITIKRKTIERVKRQRDNPTFFKSNSFPIRILISTLESLSPFCIDFRSSINELYDKKLK